MKSIKKLNFLFTVNTEMKGDNYSLTMHPPLSTATGNIPHTTPAP